jgi:hypothetical protein
MLALCAVFLLAPALGSAQDSPPQEQSQQAALQSLHPSLLVTLHGIVMNSVTGQPLPRALVRIEGDANTGALTDGEGRFQIPGLPVGPQTIRVHKPGFHDRPYATEDVGYQNDGPAHSVLVAAEMPDVAFMLTPTSAIYGHVELSTGDPALGITLTLLKQVVRNGRAVWVQDGTTRTNGNGAYRFAGLPAGRYALFTQPALESEPAVTAVAAGASVARNGYPSVFYPQAQDFSGATRIRLAAGDQAEANLRLPLVPFYTVTATAILPNGRPFGSNGPSEGSQPHAILVLDAAGHRLAYTGQFDAGTHTLQTSLPDGTYTFYVVVWSDEPGAIGHGNTTGRSNRKQWPFSGFVEFSVDGRAVKNLRIPVSPIPGWLIHLQEARISALPAQSYASAYQGIETQLIVLATNADEARLDGSSEETTAEAVAPGLLELTVGPGSHWISTQLNDRNLCVDSFSAGGMNLAREPLSVALGASPPPMELTLRDDCAKLALTLPPARAEFLPGDEPFYTVYVVPDFDTTADIPPMNMHPSSGATLNVDGLTPGNYHVYVFNRPVRLEYRNPAALAALSTPGQSVTLSPGATSSLMLEVPAR